MGPGSRGALQPQPPPQRLSSGLYAAAAAAAAGAEANGAAAVSSAGLPVAVLGIGEGAVGPAGVPVAGSPAAAVDRAAGAKQGAPGSDGQGGATESPGLDDFAHMGLIDDLLSGS